MRAFRQHGEQSRRGTHWLRIKEIQVSGSPGFRVPGILLLLVLLCACGEDALVVGVNAPDGTRSTLQAGPFLPLSTSGLTILDAAGRQVLLRGLQHHALQDVAYKGREVLPEDYPKIASWGFTTLRLAISWSRIEPTQGTYDSAYLAEIKAAMDLAHQAGLTVILEWHQDLWGRCAVEKGSSFYANANGAPDWTCPAGFVPSGTLDYWSVFDDLWQNKRGLLDAYTAAWLAVIKAVGTHPALLGYDLFNEPQGSGGSPTLEKNAYFPALRAVIPKLRQGGATGLLFIDATGLRNDTFIMYAEPLDTIGKDLVYAPHLYSGWLLMYILKRSVPESEKKRDMAEAKKQAAAMKLPLWNGEWGVNLGLEEALKDLAFHAALEDENLVGSSYWAFQKAVPGQGDPSISGAQALLDANRQVRTAVLDRLSRPYPIATPGTLLKVRYPLTGSTVTGGTLEVELELAKPESAPLRLYAPRRHLGSILCLAVSGPGGWRWDEDPKTEQVLVQFTQAGQYAVRLGPCQ